MKITVHSDIDNRKITDIILKGEINRTYSEKLYTEIKKMNNHKENNLLIDLSNVAEITNDGFLTLGSIIAYCSNNNMNFAFFSNNKDVISVIANSEYADFIKVFSDKDKAIKEILRPKKRKKH